MGEVVSLDEYSSVARRVEGTQPGGRRPTVGMDVCFDRRELSRILNVYGNMVARGDWRDYAIAHGPEQATFAVFQRAAESPLFRITKTPKLARKQGAFQVIARDGRVLKRGHELDTVLRVFDSRRFSVVDD
ncbi:MAG: DUF2794 domain-containing protein [Minwuia sp.]|nr:DUF2794 domain-containing protein [Minwuia sp.]